MLSKQIKQLKGAIMNELQSIPPIENTTKITVMSNSCHNRLALIMPDNTEYSFSGIDSEQEYSLDDRWKIEEFLKPYAVKDSLYSVNGGLVHGELYFEDFIVPNFNIEEALK